MKNKKENQVEIEAVAEKNAGKAVFYFKTKQKNWQLVSSHYKTLFEEVELLIAPELRDYETDLNGFTPVYEHLAPLRDLDWYAVISTDSLLTLDKPISSRSTVVDNLIIRPHYTDGKVGVVRLDEAKIIWQAYESEHNGDATEQGCI